MTVGINGSNLISKGTLFIRDLILDNVTDPISGTRQSNSKFCTTSWPGRITNYPIITIEQTNMTEGVLGHSSNDTLRIPEFTINVFSLNVKQRDGITGSILQLFRTNQHATTGSGFIENSLYAYSLKNCFNMPDPSDKRIRRKVIEVEWQNV